MKFHKNDIIQNPKDGSLYRILDWDEQDYYVEIVTNNRYSAGEHVYLFVYLIDKKFLLAKRFIADSVDIWDKLNEI